MTVLTADREAGMVGFVSAREAGADRLTLEDVNAEVDATGRSEDG